MIFWMDIIRSNWSLVMVAFQASDERYHNSREDFVEGQRNKEYYYDYDDDDDDDYDDDAQNNTILVHMYPFWIGASKSTGYSCGECTSMLACVRL